MSAYQIRRAADVALWRAAKRIRKDRSQPRKTRRAAWKVSLAFWLRIKLRWHGEPKPWLKKLTGDFRYGEYCGVGVGLPEGETAEPVDALDAVCRDHDAAYLPADSSDG